MKLGFCMQAIVTICSIPLWTRQDLTNKRVFAGATFIVAAELMFALMGASIRQVSTGLNNGMVVFARNLVAVLLIRASGTQGPAVPPTTALGAG